MVTQILVDRQRRHRPRPRRYWVMPWLSRRLDNGHYDRLMRELEAEDVVSFRNFVRMDPAMFRELLQRVAPRIEKYDTYGNQVSQEWWILLLQLQGLPFHHTSSSGGCQVPVLMPRSSMTVICARALLMAPWIYLMQSHCLVTTMICHTFSLEMMPSP